MVTIHFIILFLIFLLIDVVPTAFAINEQSKDCLLPLRYRNVLVRTHNGLRLFVARGGLDKKKHLMYGVNYDCRLEEVAKNTISGENRSDDYGVIRFSQENFKNPHEAIIEGINELLDDEEHLKQAIYPPITRFGCYSEVNFGKKIVDGACVYNAKLARYESNFQEKGHGPCMKNDDCIYHKSSICTVGLCFTAN